MVREGFKNRGIWRRLALGINCSVLRPCLIKEGEPGPGAGPPQVETRLKMPLRSSKEATESARRSMIYLYKDARRPFLLKVGKKGVELR